MTAEQFKAADPIIRELSRQRDLAANYESHRYSLNLVSNAENRFTENQRLAIVALAETFTRQNIANYEAQLAAI